MKKILALLLLAISSLIAEDWRTQVQEIDGQIKEMQDERTKLLGRANRLERQCAKMAIHARSV